MSNSKWCEKCQRFTPAYGDQSCQICGTPPSGGTEGQRLAQRIAEKNQAGDRVTSGSPQEGAETREAEHTVDDVILARYCATLLCGIAVDKSNEWSHWYYLGVIRRVMRAYEEQRKANLETPRQAPATPTRIAPVPDGIKKDLTSKPPIGIPNRWSSDFGMDQAAIDSALAAMDLETKAEPQPVQEGREPVTEAFLTRKVLETYCPEFGLRLGIPLWDLAGIVCNRLENRVTPASPTHPSTAADKMGSPNDLREAIAWLEDTLDPVNEGPAYIAWQAAKTHETFKTWACAMVLIKLQAALSPGNKDAADGN